jgi:hypothetical protein
MYLHYIIYMKTYYIYHIPNFVRKDGSLGKIGCTYKSILERAEEQGYREVELLETHTDIYIASDREIELQLQYDYKVDSIPYWQSIENNREGLTKEACSKGGTIGGRLGGRIGGRKNVESGHLASIQSKAGKVGGKVTCSIERICPHCSTPIKGPNYFKNHGDRCKQKKEAI